MKLLLISDHENSFLWDYYVPGRLDGIDLILSCGDLKPEYLSFLVTMGRAPVLYVCGNHDGRYEKTPPEGCDCIEDKLVTIKGLRILGMGGCPVYNKAGGVDILLSHAPAAGWGDADDFAHRGFECFNDFLDKYQPKYHVHGHVHMNYGSDIPRTLQRGGTTIINAWDKYILEI